MLLSALLVGCGGGNTHRSVENPPQNARIIPLTDSLLLTGGSDTVRFGRLHAGEIALQHLWLENQASQPMVVVGYDRSCGCTSLEFDRKPILAGEKQRLTLYFDSRGERGWQLKTVDIRLANAQKSVRLWVEAEIE